MRAAPTNEKKISNQQFSEGQNSPIFVLLCDIVNAIEASNKARTTHGREDRSQRPMG
jgi:hypothetical protein